MKKKVNSTRMPVYRDSGFELFDAATMAKAFNEEKENEREPELYIYSRFRNPTVIAAEEEIMKLENSGWALLTQSGMSAVDTALSIFQNGKNNRPWLFFTEIYGGTISFAESVLQKRRGLEVHTFAPVNERYDLKIFESAVKTLRPEIVYFETISNPLLIVPDVRKIIKISREYGAITIVDNTFATPLLWKPLSDGADIVIHSATKYLSGHGNITAGVVCGNDNELMKAAIEYRKYVGHLISPDDAYRLNTQLFTLDVRFKRQCLNASRISRIFRDSKHINRVCYPGSEDHPSYGEAVKLFGNKGFGGMLTLDFAGEKDSLKREKRDTFIKTVSEKIKVVPSLGDPYSIMMPVEAVWGSKYHEPGMIRLSVGYEDTDDLAEIISGALEKI